jgi:hypothetical protein
MIYWLLGMWPTHDLSSLGLSVLAIHRPRKSHKPHRDLGYSGQGSARHRDNNDGAMAFAGHASCHKERNQGSLDDRGTNEQTQLYQDRTPCFTTV